MNKEASPYVVSADVNRLMKRWSISSGYEIPSNSFFDGMLEDTENVLKNYFERVHIVQDNLMHQGLYQLASQSELPVISLDRAYVDDDLDNLVGYLDISRSVDENMQSRNISERPGSQPVEVQLNNIVKSLPTNRIAILDDVLFEGGTHLTVSDWFLQKGVHVEKVLVGIAIGEGADKLKSHGIDVVSLFNYESVVDEVCERDFVAGVPMSGRTVVSDSGEVLGGLPYFLPFGNPEKWASIPAEYTRDFSMYCLEQSISLWSKTEKLSNKTLSVGNLPKSIYGANKNNSVVDELLKLKI